MLGSWMYKGVAMESPNAITYIQKGRILIIQVKFSKAFHSL
jgi:hypothetical protein